MGAIIIISIVRNFLIPTLHKIIAKFQYEVGNNFFINYQEWEINLKKNERWEIFWLPLFSMDLFVKRCAKVQLGRASAYMH